LAFADWLVAVGASTTHGELPICDGRHSVSGVVAPTLNWLSAVNPNEDDKTAIEYLTFNTPPNVPSHAVPPPKGFRHPRCRTEAPRFAVPLAF